MENLNKPILDQLIETAFPQLASLDYSFSEYSLNTSFSFKFDNLDHFVEFLKQHQTVEDEEVLLMENMLKDLNLRTHSYFFVNFYE